ncbi:porin family protein [Sulfurovum sp. NBC37-1]|uniref:porin family protein n=1 Tax=Sulfurovum sp. (strain NBC37-1) TaxID=387093 RepID=UPI00015875F6|nr:porin family protein [Sulfurovum sp. NBC37-1]BAF71847.1 hypothetical protein SUN_0889 [Sulfurovum sp. NBC37-1]
MKNIKLTVAVFCAMGAFAMAGGDIAPVEPVEEIPVVVSSDAGFYVGLAYAAVHNEVAISNGRYGDVDYHGYMLQAGYKFNPYIAVEARYWDTKDDKITTTHPTGGTRTLDAQFDAWGVYLKPMYPVTEALDVYVLLGWGHQDSQHGPYNPKDSSFSWGGGASYSLTENISVFADYVRIYDDTAIKGNVNPFGEIIDVDVESSSWNIGLSYKF